ncbi:MerR family transcriptional regulator [Nocardia stercoris]|uniref:MerR family transcriptional regulator n=1 Tax=Nocardia stercoris TaxID=2483361 RepID=A0A3M2LB55_9NOCA|nr:MerR family transcriptional regulator [Nocardia stercoris]RMI33960.1 MerR family transcriptional regulator [Nocardia stercoris]
MSAYLSIGDFSRASHLTVKTLRHYHQVGLLVPAAVDSHTGYRRYSTEQLAIAQVVRRFRDLDMPLDDIRAVLATPDPDTRNTRIVGHLDRLEEQLDRTRQAVDQLRDLLTRAPGGPTVEQRSTPAVTAAAITDVVAAEDGPAWLQGALGELHATLTAQRLTPTGPAGGIYSDEVFTQHRGESTIFVPCAGTVRPVGRVRSAVVPAAELAVISHFGSPAGVDRTYSALAAYVAGHALGVPGPIREYYLVGQRDTTDSDRWHTEIGWPIFRTGTSESERPGS